MAEISEMEQTEQMEQMAEMEQTAQMEQTPETEQMEQVAKCKYCWMEDGRDMITCSTCGGFCHPLCLELPEEIVPVVKTYDWQCNDCKQCYECNTIENEEKILFCDSCDRGYHMYCITPLPVKRRPKGKWFCAICQLQREKHRKKPGTNPHEKKMKVKESADTKRAKSKDTPNRSEKTKFEKSADFAVDTCCEYSNEVKRCPFSGCDAIKRKSSMGDEDKPKKKPLQSNNKENQGEENTAEKIKRITKVLEKEMAPNSDGLQKVVFGGVELEVWYKSLYPDKLTKLYVCEYCLNYMKTNIDYAEHMNTCTLRKPPGKQIYCKDNLSLFEVDGATSNSYCKHLCLLVKLWLDHKPILLDVPRFLFYVMTISDEKGCHIVGYFSKEKCSKMKHNASCLLVVPHHMKKGYGRLLIDFSYLLSSAEGKVGTPERPLSDAGIQSYRRYWENTLLKYLDDYSEESITIKAISEKTAMNADDVVSTLKYLGLLKFWQGKHFILVKKEVMEEYLTKVKERPEDHMKIDTTCLTWSPPQTT